MNNFLPNWPAPANIGAVTTIRTRGRSKAPFDSNNMGLHVGDVEENVIRNREQLRRELSLPNDPMWLEQTHSNRCVVVEEESMRIADAAVTRNPNYPLVIMTADCLPILLCNQEGTEIAAIHSGWRGLADGILENTIAKMHSSPSTLMAWVGPAICGACYEVGDDVVDAYLRRYPQSVAGFRPHGERSLANLPQIAEWVFKDLGISSVYQANACTLEQKNNFYSYRREGQTGRMATLIWFKQDS
jgi:YfiH family protein